MKNFTTFTCMKRILILTASTLAVASALAVAVAERQNSFENDGLCLVIVDEAPSFGLSDLHPIYALKFEAVIPAACYADFERAGFPLDLPALKQKQVFNAPLLGINQMARPPNWRA